MVGFACNSPPYLHGIAMCTSYLSANLHKYTTFKWIISFEWKYSSFMVLKKQSGTARVRRISEESVRSCAALVIFANFVLGGSVVSTHLYVSVSVFMVAHKICTYDFSWRSSKTSNIMPSNCPTKHRYFCELYASGAPKHAKPFYLFVFKSVSFSFFADYHSDNTIQH